MADEKLKSQRDYQEYILAWLVGRLSANRTIGQIPRQQFKGPSDSPHIFWWVLEGKPYRGFGTLADGLESGAVRRKIRQLLLRYSPKRRITSNPEGDTDWPATALHNATALGREFVSNATSPGLGDEEKFALLKWEEWIEELWRYYDNVFNDSPLIKKPSVSDFPLKKIRHIAKRSRWPFMRNVVAESVRRILEPQEFDQLPLPDDHETVFELYCMVKLLHTLEPDPECIRWIDIHTEGEKNNQIRIPGIELSFQYNCVREKVLRTSEFDGGLRAAEKRHRLRVHHKADGLLRFTPPRSGFNAVVIEVKSGGSSSFNTAVPQLKSYRAALRQDPDCGRLLVWGIIEKLGEPGDNEEGREAMAEDYLGNTGEDLWVFSSAENIPEVLRKLGLSKEYEPNLAAVS